MWRDSARWSLVTSRGADCRRSGQPSAERWGPGRGRPQVPWSRMRWAASPNLILALNTVRSLERPQSGTQVSLPDIDASTSMVGRVLDYVGEKYGRDKVACAWTHWHHQTKQALKDSARIMGIRLLRRRQDHQSLLPPHRPAARTFRCTTSSDQVKRYAEAREFRELYDSDPDAKRITDEAMARRPDSSDRCARLRHLIMGSEPIISYVLLFGAFCSNDNLKNVVIQDGVTQIESWAFSNCPKLASVAIPESEAFFDDYILAIVTTYHQP